ncbi:MAG: hypothetical protein JNL12_15375 [Planctomycetes bacterium]|nr:hypothetical protein [Planctomycetota bacterium]
MNVLRRTLPVLAAVLGSCVVPDLTRATGYLGEAQLSGRSRAEVLGALGPPTAVAADGSAFLYALPDNDWVFVAVLFFVGVVVPLDPHWDVRFVAFDRRGFVQRATELTERRATLDRLVEEMATGAWR